MSQTFNVVKCFDCQMYQVDICKTSTNKWSCKLCGHKQSLKQFFFQGDSKECRERVRLLNANNGQRQIEQDNMNILKEEMKQQQHQDYVYSYDESFDQVDYNQQQRPKISKWAKYLNEEEFERYYGDDNTNNFNENDQQS